MYLGVFFHWLSTAAAAATAREATGWKVFGSISESLRSVPFLLFFRTLEVAESTTGGAFLYGAELCSAFISLIPSSLAKAFSGWLLCFGSKRRAS